MLNYLPRWSDVLFPGFCALALGVTGAWIARRQLHGEVTWLYTGLAVLAFWASFGPPAGLYAVLYSVVPLFAWLRAPARFGLLVVFSLSVLTGFAVAELLRRVRHPNVLAAVLTIAVIGELFVTLDIPRVERFEPVYRTLAALPDGAVIEMPFYFHEVGIYQNTRYMLRPRHTGNRSSTATAITSRRTSIRTWKRSSSFRAATRSRSSSRTRCATPSSICMGTMTRTGGASWPG